MRYFVRLMVSLKNRQTYGAEKEARIADLKKLLAEATSDEQRYGFCGRLFR